MDFGVFVYYVLVLIQIILIFTLFYFSGRLLLTMFTLSPFYKGKVPYVPTRRHQIPIAFELLKINEGDKVIDLGCGNGQFLAYGARRVNAEFIGVELNFVLYAVARINTLLARKKGSVLIKHSDYFNEDLRKYNKVFIFHMPTQIEKVGPKLEKELRAGTKIVSIIFPIESTKLKLLTERGEKHKLFLYERVD